MCRHRRATGVAATRRLPRHTTPKCKNPVQSPLSTRVTTLLHRRLRLLRLRLYLRFRSSLASGWDSHWHSLHQAVRHRLRALTAGRWIGHCWARWCFNSSSSGLLSGKSFAASCAGNWATYLGTGLGAGCGFGAGMGTGHQIGNGFGVGTRVDGQSLGRGSMGTRRHRLGDWARLLW